MQGKQVNNSHQGLRTGGIALTNNQSLNPAQIYGSDQNNFSNRVVG